MVAEPVLSPGIGEGRKGNCLGKGRVGGMHAKW